MKNKSTLYIAFVALIAYFYSIIINDMTIKYFFKHLWSSVSKVLSDFFIPDDGVISREALKRLRHYEDRKILKTAYDELRKQQLSGVEEPTVTVTYSDGTKETIISVQGTTVVN